MASDARFLERLELLVRDGIAHSDRGELPIGIPVQVARCVVSHAMSGTRATQVGANWFYVGSMTFDEMVLSAISAPVAPAAAPSAARVRPAVRRPRPYAPRAAPPVPPRVRSRPAVRRPRRRAVPSSAASAPAASASPVDLTGPSSPRSAVSVPLPTFECVVCLDAQPVSSHAALLCHHPVCAACWTRCRATSVAEGRWALCPVCRLPQ